MITPNYIRRKLHNLTHPLLGRILMLHRVTEQRSVGDNRELEVTPDFLEHTIEEYRQQGHHFVSIDEVCDILVKGSTKQPFVCLTFDDGYQDNYTTALPLLKRLNIPFAIYITTGFIDNRQPIWWYRCESREQCQTCLSNVEVQQRERSYPNDTLGLGLDSLRALDAEPLCTICAHTISHPRLDSLSVDEQRKEIAMSKTTLEEWLGHPVDHFSYPHGAYNEDTLAIVRDCGFHSALMAWGGTVRRGADQFLLHRIELRQL